MKTKRIENDTIAAISTALGPAGIGIVRISGPKALAIADKIFLSKEKLHPSQFKTYTLHYGWIVNKVKHKIRDAKSDEIIDEVILGLMRSPRSYTKEDIVEINCHSGISVLNRILDLVLSCGARMADPGEFTKRAFLSGRIDLVQAEAVLDIIKARTDKARALGLGQLRGNLSQEIDEIRQRAIKLSCRLEVNIDFPEDDIDCQDNFSVKKILQLLRNDILALINTCYQGRILRQGVLAVICGRPNVGKSSLINALLKQERSIVTHIAGTTRDTIEEAVDIKGIPVRIVDTAGIVKPKGLIEKKAVARARQYMRMADIILLVFDASQKLAEADYRLIKQVQGRKILAVLNKSDLKTKIEKEKINRLFKGCIEISALRNKNIMGLEEKIAKIAGDGKLDGANEALAINARQKQLLIRAKQALDDAVRHFKEGFSPEIIAEGLKQAINALDQISGKSFGEDLLKEIFSEFCIGK